MRPSDLQGGAVGEDVVTEVLQWGLRVRCGELGRLLHRFTDGDINFLSNQKEVFFFKLCTLSFVTTSFNLCPQF